MAEGEDLLYDTRRLALHGGLLRRTLIARARQRSPPGRSRFPPNALTRLISGD
jgi:hypothetical protein